MAFFELAKNWNLVQKFFREIDLFDYFTSFLVWTFLNFLAHFFGNFHSLCWTRSFPPISSLLLLLSGTHLVVISNLRTTPMRSTNIGGPKWPERHFRYGVDRKCGGCLNKVHHLFSMCCTLCYSIVSTLPPIYDNNIDRAFYVKRQ